MLTAVQLPGFWDVSLISGHRGVMVIYSGARSFRASSTCCLSGSWVGCVWAYVSGTYWLDKALTVELRLMLGRSD